MDLPRIDPEHLIQVRVKDWERDKLKRIT